MPETFLNPDISLPFCPGCGQAKVVRALDRALASTGLPADGIVVVTDIGCSGLSDRHFTTHAFHGLHGRSITYGTGIKLARPDLEVVVLLGDGGCGIGGTHLINAARRNIGLTVLVSNNFNFGMTGGEHSVTTPQGGLTSTTPWGNPEIPLDLCRLVESSGGTFVARSSAFDPDLEGLLLRALRHEGFAFVDVWSVCSAYFGPRNRLTPRAVKEMAEASGMGTGVLHETERPEFSSALRRLAEKAEASAFPGIQPGAPASLDKPSGLVIAGSAGQRVRSGASLLGRAAIASGLYATQKDDYPITVRTGHSVSELILSPEEILYTSIETPAVMVLLSKDGLGQVRNRLDTLRPPARILADVSLAVSAPEGVDCRFLPLAKAATKLGRASVTVLALGALLAMHPLIPFEAFLEAAASHPDAKIAEASRKAAEAGRALAATSGS